MHRSGIFVILKERRGEKMKEQQIYMMGRFILFENEQKKRDFLSDWLIFARILAEPETIQIAAHEPQPFDLAAVLKEFEALALSTASETAIQLASSAGTFAITLQKSGMIEQNVFSEALYFAHEAVITDYWEQRFSANGLYGYLRSYEEYLLANTGNRRMPPWVSSARSIKNERSLSGNPAGRDIYDEYLLLSSCWKMYFSRFYFQLYPKPLFFDLQGIEETAQLPEDSLRVTLFKDWRNWEHPANLHYQKLFRQQMGIDQLAPASAAAFQEPYIEFAVDPPQVETLQFYNKNLQPTPKSKATFFTTRRFDVLSHEYVEFRTKGSLNLQAYFPEIDLDRRQMVKYLAIDPRIFADKGFTGFNYYLHRYLDLPVVDPRMKDFQLLFFFFLPPQTLALVPFDRLKTVYHDQKSISGAQEHASAKVEWRFETPRYPITFRFVEVSEDEERSLVRRKRPRLLLPGEVDRLSEAKGNQ